MNVLVIDDHTTFAESLCVMLQQQLPDLCCSASNDPQQCLDHLLSSDSKGPDLILLDFDMPGINGMQFIQALYQQQKFLPVVMLSAFDKVEVIDQVLAYGAMGFIPKTYSIKALVTALSICLEGEIYLPDSLRARLYNYRQHCQRSQQAASQLQITRRQLEVLQLLEQGKNNQDIAKLLNISHATVKTHVHHIYRALNVFNRKSCLEFAYACGLLHKQH